MSSATDKARFYLEASVPELRDLERRKIFTKDEITSIVKKRSDFEHKLNSRGGSNPSDYARYAEYEMNLDALRLKRCKRMGIKKPGYNGTRLVFFILDRGTRKFYYDMGLWMQYIEFARKNKSYKKLEQILTSVLRMHPTRPELWVYAATYAVEVNADMTAARSYMQRGLRFCKHSPTLWLEYAKLEMLYIAKIAMRRNILGLEGQASSKEVGDTSADNTATPTITAEDINPSLEQDAPVDDDALQNLASTPVLSGAIPIAIFEAAMKQFPRDLTFAEQFFDTLFEFEQVPALPKILSHVLEHMLTADKHSVQALACEARIPLANVRPTSPDFPSALGVTLQRFKSASKTHFALNIELAKRAAIALIGYLADEELDASVRRVLLATLRQNCQTIDSASADGGSGEALVAYTRKLKKDGQSRKATLLAQFCHQLRKSNAELQKLAR